MGFTVTFHTNQDILLKCIFIIDFSCVCVCGLVHMRCPQRLGASDLVTGAVSHLKWVLGSSARAIPSTPKPSSAFVSLILFTTDPIHLLFVDPLFLHTPSL